MPISLESLQVKLAGRVNTLNSAFDRYIASRGATRRVDRNALQEGLISALWQSWCGFCRATILHSASGNATVAGMPVASPYAGRSEPEIAWIAKRLAQQDRVSNIRSLTAMREEPTWGDVTKLNLITAGIPTSNQSTLVSSFSAPISLKDLQLCRNASAHINRDVIADLNGAKVRYSRTALSHPSDMMTWIDPQSGDFVWRLWVDEIIAVSQLATS